MQEGGVYLTFFQVDGESVTSSPVMEVSPGSHTLYASCSNPDTISPDCLKGNFTVTAKENGVYVIVCSGKTNAKVVELPMKYYPEALSIAGVDWAIDLFDGPRNGFSTKIVGGHEKYVGEFKDGKPIPGKVKCIHPDGTVEDF
ncbi:MAG: hypothetical protein MRJ65_15095 [Candidatus Brocadiaceae bacterium]|nr:hypothetical protein [Candidatus Brocadiaceae bacterium]